MEVIFIYVTVPTESEAMRLAEAVVADRLAACANIISGTKSVYHWEGKLEQGHETVVIFKTRASLFPEVEARVKQLHSYEVPCIVALPLTDVSDGFMQWIYTETK
ncbi:MAG: divalent-cation tolerance protein CutA [Proteobacteria bacterium]|nr:divalent-cation tolerance protein CutA [Pseudomonadota bacterium]